MLIFASAFLSATLGRGQVGAAFDMVETKVGRADRVYFGTFTKVQATSDQGWQEPESVTLAVSETLKGPTKKSVKFSPADSVLHFGTATFKAWREQKTPILLYHAVQGWRWLNLGASVKEEKSYYIPEAMGIFTFDMKKRAQLSEALSTARAFAKRYPKVLETVEFNIPMRTALITDHSGSWNVMQVPICPEIEKLAHEFITSPASFLPGAGLINETVDGDAALVRSGGIKILAHFKTRDNIALLQKLAKSDPYKGPLSAMAENRGEYPVRVEAKKVLLLWKAK